MTNEKNASMVMTKCQTAVVIKDDLYVVDGNTGYLNIIDLNVRSIKKTIYMDKIYDSSVKLAYVLKVEQSVWVVPLYAATMIAEYNLLTEKVIFYNLGENSSYCFSYVINIGTIIYLIPLRLPGMLLQFSTQTHKIISDDRWLKIRNMNCNATIFMATNLSSKLFFVLVNGKRLISYDLFSGKLQEKNLNIEGGIKGITIYKNRVCLTLEKMNFILLWDYKKDSVQKKELELKDEFFIPVVVEDRILLSNGREVFWFFDDKIELIKNLNELTNDTTHAAHFYKGYIWRDKVILPPCHSNMFLEIDKNTYETSGFTISLPQNDKMRYFLMNTPVRENGWSSLVEYINTI